MGREQPIARQDHKMLDLAAVWPSSATFAPLPVWEVELVPEDVEFHATPAAPDVPAAVGGLVAASYAGLIVALAVATAGSGQSIFAITISALFVLMYFAVPRILFAVERDSGVRASMDVFLRSGIITYTGHNSAKAALVQMLIVPVSLTFAVLAMGVAIATVR
jgi:hypothetical protein